MVVRVLLLGLVGFGLLTFVAQRWVAFPGVFRESPRSSASAPVGVAQLWLETSFGRVEAWLFLAAGDGPRPTAIFAHGNGELIEDWEGDMRRLAAAGVNSLIVEFPGYGHSEGKPSRATLRETYSLAFDRLAERTDVDSDRIVAFGRSMGGGAAGDLALDRPAAALILASTFSSTMAVANEILVPGFLVRDRFDNQRVVTDFEGPVLLMHGTADDVIPFSHAETLAAARDGLEIIALDCAHNDCGSQWPTIVETVGTFLRENSLLD